MEWIHLDRVHHHSVIFPWLRSSLAFSLFVGQCSSKKMHSTQSEMIWSCQLGPHRMQKWHDWDLSAPAKRTESIVPICAMCPAPPSVWRNRTLGRQTRPARQSLRWYMTRLSQRIPVCTHRIAHRQRWTAIAAKCIGTVQRWECTAKHCKCKIIIIYKFNVVESSNEHMSISLVLRQPQLIDDVRPQFLIVRSTCWAERRFANGFAWQK